METFNIKLLWDSRHWDLDWTAWIRISIGVCWPFCCWSTLTKFMGFWQAGLEGLSSSPILDSQWSDNDDNLKDKMLLTIVSAHKTSLSNCIWRIGLNPCIGFHWWAALKTCEWQRGQQSTLLMGWWCTWSTEHMDRESKEPKCHKRKQAYWQLLCEIVWSMHPTLASAGANLLDVASQGPGGD